MRSFIPLTNTNGAASSKWVEMAIVCVAEVKSRRKANLMLKQ